MARFGNFPCIIGADTNRDVYRVGPLAAALAKVIIRDAAECMAATRDEQPENTYRATDRIMDAGPGATRIDYFLANAMAWSKMVTCGY